MNRLFGSELGVREYSKRLRFVLFSGLSAGVGIVILLAGVRYIPRRMRLEAGVIYELSIWFRSFSGALVSVVILGLLAGTTFMFVQGSRDGHRVNTVMFYLSHFYALCGLLLLWSSNSRAEFLTRDIVLVVVFLASITCGFFLSKPCVVRALRIEERRLKKPGKVFRTRISSG